MSGRRKTGQQPPEADNVVDMREAFAGAAPRQSTDPPPQVGPKDEIDVLVEEFNQKHAVVNESGKAIVYRELYDAIRQRRFFERIKFEDFAKLHANRLITVGVRRDVPIRESAGKIWLNHPKRRQYIEGVVFDPTSKQKDGVLNLWLGYSIEPKPGSWDRLRTHIWEVVCRRSRWNFNYLMAWMARMVQLPAQQGEVAVVLYGVPGSGKSTLGKALRRIMGQHGIKISTTEHLVGRFNQHLRDCVFLFGDEAFFAGDKAHVDVLKSLITEESLTIEGKGLNVVQAPNYLHLMLASNEKWVVPADMRDRRYFVLAVGNEHCGDRAYWTGLYDELDNGGYEAMLYELLNMDLSHFDVRSVPQTIGLQEQKQETLELDYRWWQDILYRGYVWESECGLANIFCRWEDTVSTELLFKSYEKFARQHRHRHPLHRNTFGRFIQEQLGAKQTKAYTIVGEQTKAGGYAEAIYGRVPAYHLGTLAISRAEFCKRTGLVLDWPDCDGMHIAARDVDYEPAKCDGQQPRHPGFKRWSAEP